MSYIKSFTFTDGDIRGDMYYIQHNSENFTLIDCYLNVDESRKGQIVQEIVDASSDKQIHRFILTHPDKDHYAGIDELWKSWSTTNVYMVKNKKVFDISESDSKKCKELRDAEDTWGIEAGRRRKYLNQGDESVESSGISFLWPKLGNEAFKKALQAVKEGKSPNNISPAILYRLEDGASFLWLGDMETDMQTEFASVCAGNIPKVDILFAPHHGRKSGHVPANLMSLLQPKIIVIGNAPSEDLDYSDADKTITCNSAGDVLFEAVDNKVHIFAANKVDNIPTCLEKVRPVPPCPEFSSGLFYLGTLTLN